jgi:DNA-directed RNA polymerase subunit RPC12/RpoP
MFWLLATLAFIAAYAIYTMVINRDFLRCPHCGKIGAWRFDSIGESDDEHDEDGALVRSVTQQRCRKCGGEVVHVWSDHEGREIRLPSGSEKT